MIKIILDAGHGMHTPGKRSPGGVNEAQQNYAVMMVLGDVLKRVGFAVEYTNTDKYVDTALAIRVRIANVSKANLFISLHANAISDEWQTKASGIETFVYGFGGKAEVVARDVQAQLIKDTAMKDRGVKVGNFQVLRNTIMPAILVELGFMDNKIDSAHMLDPIWHKIYANAIAKGVCKFYNVPFTDVEKPKDDWKVEPIREMLNKGIITSKEWLDVPDGKVSNWQLGVVINRTIEYLLNQNKNN